MSDVSLHNSDTTESGLNMYAVQVDGGANDMFSKLCEFIGNKPAPERLLILCDEKNSRNTMLSLLGKGMQSCIFHAFIHEDSHAIEKEKEKFNQIKLAICSFESYEKIGLSLIENYVFLGFPTKRTNMPKILSSLDKLAEKENSVIRIDFIVPNTEEPAMFSALYMEMKKRRNSYPLWLAEYLIMKFTPVERQAELLDEERKKNDKRSNFLKYRNNTVATSSETSGSPISSFLESRENSPAPVNQSSQNVDIANIKPSADGKFVTSTHHVELTEHFDYSTDDEQMSYDEGYDYENALSDDFDDYNEFEYD